MRKGTFATPRDLGAVPEIRIEAIRVTLEGSLSGNEQIVGELAEGEEVGGVFQVKARRTLVLDRVDMATATKTSMDNFLRAIIREYNTQEGYTGVVVT